MSENDRGERSGEVWFGGDYASWGEACAASTGYDALVILERVIAATRKVVSGEAAYERDGVTFGRIEYSMPLLASLLYVATRSANRLNLLDIGGSLGSSYRQNRKFLEHLSEVRWSVVEQPHFAAAGQAEFETEQLRFFGSMADCLAAAAPRVALLSGVLQYVPEPYRFLAEVLGGDFEFVLLDRSQFFVEDIPERLTVEHVPPEIYEASYPAWFLNLGRFRDFVATARYNIVAELDSWEQWQVDGHLAQNKCLLLERIC